MPKIRVQVPHQLEREVAVDRLQSYSRQIKSDFSEHVSHVEETWSEQGTAEFSFKAFGLRISGTTIVHAMYAEVHVQLPFAAIPLRGLIEKEIANRLELALSGQSA
jgi:hypothetical protein